MESVRNHRGFTLTELVIVIAVFAVLTAVAAPSFEALVNGSGSNRATLELISDLQLARMTAIRTHQPTTMAFNQPAQDQYTVSWTDNGDRSKEVSLNAGDSRIVFDTAPPGSPPAPNASFTFTSLGLIRTDTGTTIGNIYIVDTTNGRRFCISTTVAGGIVERRWTGSNWSGPVLAFTPGP